MKRHLEETLLKIYIYIFFFLLLALFTICSFLTEIIMVIEDVLLSRLHSNKAYALRPITRQAGINVIARNTR